jgi:hypothetical protein
LLAHAAGLYPRGARADPGALEDGDPRTAAAQLACDCDSDDACSYDGDVEWAAGHDQHTLNSAAQTRLARSDTGLILSYG